MNLRQEIEKIVNNDTRYYYRTIKRLYPKFYKQMETDHRPLAENIYCWLYNNNEDILCKCGKNLTFHK